MTTLIEADVEQAARDWLESLDWRVAHRQDTSPGAPVAERVRDALQPGLVVGRSRTNAIWTGEVS